MTNNNNNLNLNSTFWKFLRIKFRLQFYAFAKHNVFAIPKMLTFECFCWWLQLREKSFFSLLLSQMIPA